MTTTSTLTAYPDAECAWGYMILCTTCTVPEVVPRHVDLTRPIMNPPAVNKIARCELCGRRGRLINPR